MTFEEFAALPDAEKLLVVEMQPRQEVQRKIWDENWDELQIVDKRFPTGDFSSANWAPFPAAPPTFWDKVADDPPDEDATYIYATGLGSSIFRFTPFSVPETLFGVPVFIQNVRVIFRIKKIAAGVNGVKPELVVGGNTYSGNTVEQIPVNAWQSFGYAWGNINPKTGVEWTIDDVNGIGPNAIEYFGITATDATPTPYCTQVYIWIIYHAWRCVGSLPWEDWGEVVRVTENCADYERVFSLADCFDLLSSFYFDCAGEILYIHTSGNDLPSAEDSNGYLYLFMAFFWIPLVNYQPAMPSAATPVVAFIPQDCLCGPVYYLPYLPANALVSVRQAVGEYHIGDIPTFDTDIIALNDGFWYKVHNELYLENARIEAKVGAIGSAYNELAVFFSGLVRRKEYGDEEATFNCKDNRQGKFKMLPLTRFSSLVYANLDPNAEGWPIPVPFGLCYNCNPTCIDIAAHKYKPSAYAIDAITAVRKGSTTLVLGVDYTINLPLGEFTLLADPLDELVTCDLRGIKIDQVTGLYSANISDFLWHTLTALWGIPAASLDPGAFLALKAARTQTCGWWMKDSTEGIEWLRMLIVSCLFHLLPDLQNKFTVTYYQAGITSATRVFLEDEFDRDQPPKRVTDTERIRQMVVLNYRFNPAAASGVAAWRTVTSPAPRTICRFDETEPVTLNTVLVVDSEAQATADLHEALLMFPGDYAIGILNARALDMLPTEKIILDKSIIMETGEQVKVFDMEAFRLFELEKDLESCKVGFVGLNDAQAAGTYHADSPHADHTDGSHNDGTYGDHDDWYNDHDDVAHVDHGDFNHGDSPHEDSPHGDYTDDWYNDHLDNPHADVPHSDGEGWLHEDVPHEDHDDHADAPHEDAPHGDYDDWFHEDSPHGDVDY